MKNIPVMAWYFPNWHPDPRNDAWHGKGWTEWEVAKCARPRFPGHEQPRVPLWGYEDESDPAVMEKKIDAALRHGIDGFLWDIYWFNEGSYRFGALDRGFFGAKNNAKCKIALMWCNHNPGYVHPCAYRNPARKLLDGEVNPQTVREASDSFIRNYFWRENYLRIDGKIYFVLWDLEKFAGGLGGVDGARMVLNDWRARVRQAGLGEMMFAAVPKGDPSKACKLMHALGVESALRYSWPVNDDNFPAEDYDEFLRDGIATFQKDTDSMDLPMSITVSTGWDSSPRTVQSDMYDKIGYPFMTCITGGTPEKFEQGLRAAREFAQSDRFTGHMITLSTWNEWTEGNYLEPDTKFGYGYLEAVRRVFGNESGMGQGGE